MTFAGPGPGPGAIIDCEVHTRSLGLHSVLVSAAPPENFWINCASTEIAQQKATKMKQSTLMVETQVVTNRWEVTRSEFI